MRTEPGSVLRSASRAGRLLVIGLATLALVTSCICVCLTLGCLSPRVDVPASQPVDTVQAGGFVQAVARFEAAVERLGVQIETRAALDAQVVTAAAGASASSNEQAAKQGSGWLQIVSQSTSSKTAMVAVVVIALAAVWGAPSWWPIRRGSARRGRSPPA
jgi:hypothetical protein